MFIYSGILQPILCVLISVVFCPLAAFFWTIGASVRYAIRTFWDTGMIFCLSLKDERFDKKKNSKF